MEPSSSAHSVPPAVRAFDETAPRFDERFGPWLSVAAQRNAVRRYLTGTFPAGGRLLELGGGTGDDALYMLGRGFRVTLTDGSPRMVEHASAKVRAAGFAATARVEQLVLEDIGAFAERHRAQGGAPFDGAWSNFAAFNCVEDLGRLAEPMAALLEPGASCVLVMFGPLPPGEILVETLRGRPRSALRRLRRGAVPARIGREHFAVWYPTPGQIAASLAPWFRLRRMRGIGVLVPPSAAEPFVSRFPRFVRALEAADRLLSAPLARLGDHVLLDFVRAEGSAR